MKTRADQRGSARGREFVGASEDGSKVFFETTQPLLGGDTSNNIYEYDFDAPPGERIVRVSGGDGTVFNPTAEVMQGDGEEHLWFRSPGWFARLFPRQRGVDEDAE